MPNVVSLKMLKLALIPHLWVIFCSVLTYAHFPQWFSCLNEQHILQHDSCLNSSSSHSMCSVSSFWKWAGCSLQFSGLKSVTQGIIKTPKLFAACSTVWLRVNGVDRVIFNIKNCKCWCSIALIQGGVFGKQAPKSSNASDNTAFFSTVLPFYALFWIDSYCSKWPQCS